VVAAGNEGVPSIVVYVNSGALSSFAPSGDAMSWFYYIGYRISLCSMGLGTGGSILIAIGEPI
jgi:hypothetical protein